MMFCGWGSLARSGNDSARSDAGGETHLGRHERQLLANAARNDCRVDDEALGDILQRREDDVGGEESFRDGNAAVCAAGKAGLRSGPSEREHI